MEDESRRAPQPRPGASQARRLCPACGSGEVRRSRRRGLKESLLSLAGILPYRCGNCDRRFLTRKLPGAR